MNCSNCKHWDNKTNVTRWHTQKDKPNKTSFGYCERIICSYSWDIDEDGQVVDSVSLIPDTTAIAEIDEGWGIVTGKNFGCTLFEEGVYEPL